MADFTAYKFYLYDETAQTFKGSVLLKIPTIDDTAVSIRTRIQLLMQATNGQPTRINESKYADLSAYLKVNESVVLTPLTFTMSGTTYNIADAIGANILLSTPRAISNIFDIIQGNYFRLCVSDTNSNANYLRYTVANRLIRIDRIHANNTFINVGVEIGQAFNVFTNTNTLFLTACAFSNDDKMVYCNLWCNNDTNMNCSFNQVADTTIVSFLKDVFSIAEPVEFKSDPYSQGGTSEPGGGGGSFDDSTDVITIPEYDPTDLLNRSYGNRGFVHVYLPTQAELTSLHAFMWNNSLITEMQKMFNNVVDAVISLNLIPLDFTDKSPNRGNILMGLVDSQIETTIAKQQFVTLDCGTIEIGEFFASYLDYSPYSKLQIYLPYIGVKDLDIDEFMNAYISVKYVIDIVSGDCVAFISKTGAIDNAVVKDNPILGVLYQFAGNCALNVPISGSNYAQMHAADIGALIGGAGILGTYMTGGISAPSAVTGILSTAANVVTSKPSISRGGSIPSTVGYMSIQKPYLILTRPRMCLPEDQNTFTGYPAYVTMTPGDTSGYTEFEIIHLENIPATDAEKNELETLMKTGVIL